MGLKTCNMVNIEIKNSVIDGLMKQREEILLKERAYSEKKYFDEDLNFFLNHNKKQEKRHREKYKDLINIKSHTLELFNWISNLNHLEQSSFL